MNDLAGIPRDVVYTLEVRDLEDYKLQKVMRKLKKSMQQDRGIKPAPVYNPRAIWSNKPSEQCNN